MIEIDTTFVRVNGHRRYRSASRRLRHTAVLRAITGARLVASGQAATARQAALCVGSTSQYVAAASVLLKTESSQVLHMVLSGRIALLAAAREAKPVANLVEAYRNASTADRLIFSHTVGLSLTTPLS